ncbi:hypothetical protein [Spiroplasma floricola]|uniref:FAD synthase n=1 Tax=Spiroplasma floricola 23-6 TaxID=1336749 RepID=A0A2K8SF44_9MOLU|nr:hypothetical protein [Spiroplasma floricola]AUB31460.1 bifunctional riboflavin kinase/FMN adenylyltransferase [Spiroplasma floricola 23-6]
MIKIKTFLNKEEMFDFNITNNIICIGFFEGIHKMHKKIILETKNISKLEKSTSSIITFSEKISDFLNKKSNNFQSKEHKYNLIEKKYNPDFLFEIQVNNEIIKKSPEEFCDFLKTKLSVKKIVVGSDFRFGFKNEGDINFLQNYFGKSNIIVFERVVGISSTLIRENISLGNIDKVKQILGENLTVSLKKVGKNKYLIQDFNITLAKGVYLIKIQKELRKVKIIENIVHFNYLNEFLEIEILEKL